MKNLPSVTLALSAFNESANIAKLLHSVFSQKQESFELKKILVISDGSTDNTAGEVLALNSRLIELRAYKNRLGKSTRLNEIYQSLETGILVQTDADVVFGSPMAVEYLVRPLLEAGGPAMCGGNPAPFGASTFTEKAVNLTFEAYAPLRKNLRGGNNVFSADGRLLAFKKELAKKILVPENMIANDMFAYFSCLASGYKYSYVPEAVVYFRSPRTLKDQIRQNTRFVAAPMRMENYFNPALVRRERRITWLQFARMATLPFLKHPLLSLYIYGVNSYCRVKARFSEKHLSALWDIAVTTKFGKS